MEQHDWVFALKDRLKRHRRLATMAFYFTDFAYLRTAERRRFLRSFPPGARLLNCGAGFRLPPAGFLGVDRAPYGGADVRADLAALPFRDNSIDGILCESVLEHVEDAKGALREFERVLAVGGRLYLAVPFLWPYHAAPHDYWRWTRSGAERDFSAFETVKSGMTGGPTTTLCNVLHEWLAIVLSFNVEPLYRVLYLALIPVLFPLKLLDFLIGDFRHADKIGALIYFHGRKPPPAARMSKQPPCGADHDARHPALRPREADPQHAAGPGD